MALWDPAAPHRLCEPLCQGSLSAANKWPHSLTRLLQACTTSTAQPRACGPDKRCSRGRSILSQFSLVPLSCALGWDHVMHASETADQQTAAKAARGNRWTLTGGLCCKRLPPQQGAQQALAFGAVSLRGMWHRHA